jgi:hypothetical protein
MATPGQQLPPGFRFHPTDEELVVQYLRRRALSRPLPAAVIPDVHDATVLDPWDLPGAVFLIRFGFEEVRRHCQARPSGRLIVNSLLLCRRRRW